MRSAPAHTLVVAAGASVLAFLLSGAGLVAAEAPAETVEAFSHGPLGSSAAGASGCGIYTECVPHD
jgi:hypothetical protein